VEGVKKGGFWWLFKVGIRKLRWWKVFGGDGLVGRLPSPFAAEGEDKEGHHKHADKGFDGGY